MFLKRLAMTLLVLFTCCTATADPQPVKIGIAHNPPISVIGENGDISGLAVDVLNDIAARQGWAIEYVPGKWAELIKQLEVGGLDLQTSIAYSEERAARFDFNETPLVVNWGVLYRASDAQFASAADLEGVRVAMIPDTTHTKAFLELLKGFDIDPVAVDVANYEQAFSMLNEGAVPYAVVSRLYGIINSQRYDVIETGMNFNPVEVGFAAPKGKNSKILKDIDDYLKAGKSTAGSNYHQYLRKYLVASQDTALSVLMLWVAGIASGAFALSILVAWGLKREVTRRTGSLKESQSKLLEAQFISRIGDFEWDLTTNLVSCSEGLNHLLGKTESPPLPVDEALARSVYPDDIKVFKTWISEGVARKDTTLKNAVIRLLCEDGQVLDTETIVKIQYDRNTPVRVFGIVHDITEQRRAERAIEKALESAMAANSAKSDFLATMSHELRTPLNAILGFVQMLQMDELEQKNPLSGSQKEYINHIHTGGAHLLNLVNEVLDVTQVETDRVKLTTEDINVKDFVKECIGQISALATQRDIKIENQLEGGPEYHLRGDALRLKQILINLLSNAINYNTEKGKIVVSAEKRENGWIRVSIADTGIGISRKQTPNVFQAFNRLGADPLVTREGAGIGLTVSKLLVEKMGGTINFVSEEGVGSTFWFELPGLPDDGNTGTA